MLPSTTKKNCRDARSQPDRSAALVASAALECDECEAKWTVESTLVSFIVGCSCVLDRVEQVDRWAGRQARGRVADGALRLAALLCYCRRTATATVCTLKEKTATDCCNRLPACMHARHLPRGVAAMAAKMRWSVIVNASRDEKKGKKDRSHP